MIAEAVPTCRAHVDRADTVDPRVAALARETDVCAVHLHDLLIDRQLTEEGDGDE